MMPSHSMDLPVPRGTSILMLAGKQKKMHMFLSPEQLLFQKDGKFFSCRGRMPTRQFFSKSMQWFIYLLALTEINIQITFSFCVTENTWKALFGAVNGTIITLLFCCSMCWKVG